MLLVKPLNYNFDKTIHETQESAGIFRRFIRETKLVKLTKNPIQYSQLITTLSNYGQIWEIYTSCWYLTNT